MRAPIILGTPQLTEARDSWFSSSLKNEMEAFVAIDRAEQDGVRHERWVAKMESDFYPGHKPESMPKPEQRLYIAAEYAAYQLGKINQSLARIAAVMEQQASKGSG